MSLDATELARHLAVVVDRALLDTIRSPKDCPTDGQIAVMAIFDELDRLGFKLKPKS